MQPSLKRLLFVWAFALSASLSGPSTFCKYSVRDVGFVNVHGQPWQLRLLRTSGAAEETLAPWQSILETQLAGTNVNFEWVSADSEPGKRLARLFEGQPSPSVPLAAIYGPDDAVFPLRLPEGASAVEFENLIESVIKSPLRDKVLDRITSALCAIVVVESGDSDLDKMAVATANAAAEQISRQMWMMEKPTKLGPAVEVISATERENERWLLLSLGLNPAAVSAHVVVVYGQGRRLGDPLTGQDIMESKIVQLASLCGQSCECDLDRVWLYGTQMIHHWGNERAAKAEESLDFDPGAAMVIAEVNGIIQRAGSGNRRNDALIGSGLVIHDFSESDKSKSPPDRGVDAASVQNDNLASNDDSAKDVDDNVRTEPASRAEQTEFEPKNEDAAARSRQTGISIAWNDSSLVLLLVVGLTVLALAFFVLNRGRE